ncbi:MAG: DNRLRE domain-containing protein [Ferruginibacter sp.]
MKSVLKSSLFCLLVSFIFTACQKDIVNSSALTPPVANAGNSQAAQLPSNSVTLTGTGTTTNGSIVGYLWSLISGPNLPVIATPSAPTTTVSNLVNGSYLLQFMVIDEAGLTGVDTVSISVSGSSIQTLVLQPSNNAYDVHVSFINGGNGTDPNAPEFSGGAWTSGGTPLLTRGAFKFDFSVIPASATILSAKLTLYSNPTPLNGNLVDANSGTANALYLERITNSWNPATISWSNQPATDLASQISLPHTDLHFLDLVDIDVTNLVATMSATNNYGFMIRLQNEIAYNIRIFASSRYSDASKHPKLVITYQ